MSSDVGEAELILHAFSHFTYVSSFWLSKLSVTSPTSQLILQPFRCFTFVTAHFPTLLSLCLRHSSFFNPFIASPSSQLIFQPFCRFTYVAAHSSTLSLSHLSHNSFSNPSFASPTSQGLHLRHLASRPCTSYPMFTSTVCFQCVGAWYRWSFIVVKWVLDVLLFSCPSSTRTVCFQSIVTWER